MNLGPFGPLLIIYGLLAVRVIFQLIERWDQTWDGAFTPADRSLVDQTAFFVLVPISVALHELGHAVMVKAYGGEILDWGYYGFAGYVGYDPTPIPLVGQMVITAAGTLVNILLAAIALWFVFIRQPPMRAAFNELLYQFVLVSLLNALLLYPLLDLSSGMNGDWAQMYRGGLPWFTALVIAVQAAILFGMWWAWRNPGIQRRIAELTGRPAIIPVSSRRGGARTMAEAPPVARTAAAGPAVQPRSEAERLFQEAGDRVIAGWPSPVDGGIHPTPDGAVLALQWTGQDLQRLVIARVAGHALELSGGIAAPGEPPVRRPLGRTDTLPTADQLTLDLRLAMEQVDTWETASTASD